MWSERAHQLSALEFDHYPGSVGKDLQFCRNSRHDGVVGRAPERREDYVQHQVRISN